MGWIEDIVIRPWFGAAIPVFDFFTGLFFGGKTSGGGDFEKDTDDKKAHGTRTALAAGAVIAATSAPMIYAYMLSKKKKKKKLTDKEELLGRTLENRAAMIHNTALAALSSPAIAVPLAYIAVQALEDFPPDRNVTNPDGSTSTIKGGMISKGLGDAIQTLLAVYAAGGVVQGVGSIASAFVRK